MSLEPFQKDWDIVELCDEILADPTTDIETLRATLQDAQKSYVKVLKRADKLVRVSDRTDLRLRDASARIKKQQEELEKAHEELASHADRLEIEVAARTADLKMERTKLAKLVELGIAMAGERDEARLLSLVLEGALELTNADGATFYLTTDDERELRFKILYNRTLGTSLVDSPETPIPIPNVALYSDDGDQPNLKNVVSYSVNCRETINIQDAYDSADYDFSGTKRFDEANGYRSTSFLTVPLIPRGGDVLGALQLINATDPETGDVVPFDDELQGFVEALAALGAVTIDNQKLLTAQRNLMDSFIELIAGAIDAKSPYTGGHCNRVPEIAMMLVREAHDSTEGPFANFAFHSEDEWREFRIGAWLHDCGKVTTPEFVVDKATKLETIYNRIHEVRTRFEVLLRDQEIERLTQRLESLGGTGLSEAEREEILAPLREKFSFVADTNIGGEFLNDAAISKLNEIGAARWTRHFDDRLGLSGEELRRMASTPVETLPTEETLLADKELHRTPREPGTAAHYAARGFKVNVPDNERNDGELYNLSIARGTLTDEERFKINDHIVQTIVMLENLPLPKHMRRIPEYAGTHHETMIGTGYPKKLMRDELSVPARVMAIADVFEALTASDRPYKKAKTLSEALKIMGFMCKDRHIDPELFELFLQSGVHQKYADEYLDPSQVDAVDTEGLIVIAQEMSAKFVENDGVNA